MCVSARGGAMSAADDEQQTVAYALLGTFAAVICAVGLALLGVYLCADATTRPARQQRSSKALRH